MRTSTGSRPKTSTRVPSKNTRSICRLARRIQQPRPIQLPLSLKSYFNSLRSIAVSSRIVWLQPMCFRKPTSIRLPSRLFCSELRPRTRKATDLPLKFDGFSKTLKIATNRRLQHQQNEATIRARREEARKRRSKRATKTTKKRRRKQLATATTTTTTCCN